MIYQSLLSRLRSQHESIPEILSTVSEEKIYQSPANGKWSIFDNIVHLASYQPTFIDRINKILQNSGTTFERYNAEADPEFASWRKLPLAEVLQRMEQDRLHIFALISNLTTEELNNIGIHTKFGKLNIILWTDFFILHEAHHIFTIFKLANEVG